MLEQTNKLLPAHNILAARELLADLRAVPELAPYLMDDIWLKADQASAISTLAAEHGISLGVGIGTKSLSFKTLKNGQNAINWTICVYAFQPARGTDEEDVEKLERVINTAFAYAMKFGYTPPGGSKEARPTPIPAIAQSIEQIDLGEEAGFAAGSMRAEALLLTIRVHH